MKTLKDNYIKAEREYLQELKCEINNNINILKKYIEKYFALTNEDWELHVAFETIHDLSIYHQDGKLKILSGLFDVNDDCGRINFHVDDSNFNIASLEKFLSDIKCEINTLKNFINTLERNENGKKYMIVNDCDIVVVCDEMAFDEIVSDAIDVAGEDLLSYPELVNIQYLNWSDKEEVDKFAKLFAELYEEDMFVVEDVL